MTSADPVALNAAMTERILAMPAQPLRDGGYALRVLRTTGRRSGLPRSTPLGVISLGGALYLVAPRRRRSWVREIVPHLPGMAVLRLDPPAAR